MRSSIRMLAVACLVAMPAGPLASRASADLVYGITAGTNQLISLDSTGAGTAVASVGGSSGNFGLAAIGASDYTFNEFSDSVEKFNPITGAIQSTIGVGISNRVGEGGFELGSNGIGFVTTPLNATTFGVTNDLYTININTGTSTRIGSTTVSIDALAMNSSGVLYGLDKDDGDVYTISTTTGALSFVGGLGAGLGRGSPYAGMAFGSGGTLYAAINDQLFTINTVTGAASMVPGAVGYSGFDSISGLLVAPSVSPVPEPASALLLAIGLGGVAAARRRKAK